MTPPSIELRHAKITKRLIGLFFDVCHELGNGFLESVYEEAFAVALEESGLKFERQKPLTVWFRGRLVGTFRADAIVEAQLLNYLKATSLTVGLIFNFGPRPKFLRRVVEGSREKITAEHADDPEARGKMS